MVYVPSLTGMILAFVNVHVSSVSVYIWFVVKIMCMFRLKSMFKVMFTFMCTLMFYTYAYDYV